MSYARSVAAGNVAAIAGGGAYGGRLISCVLVGNSTDQEGGGGARHDRDQWSADRRLRRPLR